MKAENILLKIVKIVKTKTTIAIMEGHYSNKKMIFIVDLVLDVRLDVNY